MTEDERRHPERFVVTSWGAIVGSGSDKERGLNRFATLRQLMIQIGRSTGLFEP